MPAVVGTHILLLRPGRTLRTCRPRSKATSRMPQIQNRVFVWSENSLAGLYVRCVCVFRCKVRTTYVLLATWRSIKFACRTERFKYTRQCKSSIDRVTRKQLPRADATQCATTRIASRRRARSAAEPSLYKSTQRD